MKTFANIEPVTDGDTDGLRKLCNQVETSMRNLKTLNVLNDSYGTLLVTILNLSLIHI